MVPLRWFLGDSFVRFIEEESSLEVGRAGESREWEMSFNRSIQFQFHKRRVLQLDSGKRVAQQYEWV